LKNPCAIFVPYKIQKLKTGAVPI